MHVVATYMHLSESEYSSTKTVAAYGGRMLSYIPRALNKAATVVSCCKVNNPSGKYILNFYLLTIATH